MADLAQIESLLSDVLRQSSLFPERDLTFHLIVNPNAGSFYKPARLAETAAVLERYVAGLVRTERGGKAPAVEVYRTEEPGHARELAAAVLRNAGSGTHVIVSCGGDGTHGEVLQSFVGAGSSQRSFAFRAPFGTGNDGCDARTIPEMCNALLGGAAPARTGYLIVRPTGMPEFYSFNIASIGLDAYVGFLTDRLKGFPVGDLYKVLADIMTVFYDVLIGVDRMEVRAVDELGNTHDLSGLFLLCAFGISGFRVYGGGKKILPGYDNVCAIEQMGLFRKLKLKGLVYRGEHQGIDKIHFLTARKLTIDYGRRVPMQLDGEPVWLQPENFPVSVDILPPSLPILR